MLKAFPSVTAEASDADAAAGRAFMWKAWQQKVRAVERSARWMPQREPIAAALLRIFLGDVPAGLAELPRPAPDAVDVDGGRADGDEGDVTFPYFTWANIMFCTLLYARSPVDARPKASLIHLLLDATRIMGFDLQLGKPGGVGGATCVPGAQASDNEAAVLAAVADCLTGASQAVFSAFGTRAC
ncbi:hypothetical protein EON68_05115 [archaeon]|nr:MAG: hypothetical protein EON68_05115 [archaeon]